MKKIKHKFILATISLLLISLSSELFGRDTDRGNIFIDREVKGLNAISMPVSSSPTTLQLFSHGRPGQLLLDGRWWDAAGILAFLQARHLTGGAIRQVNIYGCEFAKDAKGKNAVAYLEAKLGISIAASTNVTGKDGDWVLEVGTATNVISLPDYNANLQCTGGGIIGGKGPNDDLDGDGVCNAVDVDDDNDGILDAIESFSCYYTEGELKTITKVTSSFNGQESYGGGGGNVSYPAGSDLITLHDKEVNNLRYFNFIGSPSTVNGSNILTLEFGTPVTLSALSPNYSLSSNTAGRAVVKGSNDGTSWSAALTSATDVSETTLKFAINTGGLKYKYYRIEATNSFLLDIWLGELTPFIASFGASAYPRPGNCTQDLDGDGIANNFDLDSDGDGCFDVLEAGVPGAAKNTGTYSDSLAVNPSNAAALVGANGFKNSLETSLESGFANYSFSLAAYDATIKGCLDSDKEGINDLTDLDDDNDGVLDVIECGYADFSNAAAPTNFNINGTAALETDAIKLTEYTNSAGFQKGAAWNKTAVDLNANLEVNFSVYLNNMISGADGIAFVLQSNNATQTAMGPEGGDMGYNGIPNGIAVEFDTWCNATYNNPTGRGDLTQEDHVSINKTSDQSLIAGSGITGTNYGGLSYTMKDGAYHDVRVLWQASTKNLRVFFDGVERVNLIIPNLVSTYLNNKSTVFWGFTGATGLAYNLQKVKIKSVQQNFVCTVDLDKDGIPNSLDLDSDGDGCPDAVEAGVVTPGNPVPASEYGVMQNGSGGVVTTNTPASNAIISGPYGTNGFANSVETEAGSNQYRSVYTYNLATDGVKSANCNLVVLANHWLSLEASLRDGAALVSWKVVEQDVDHYIVQRSVNGRDFNSIIGTVGVQHSGAAEKRYSYVDKQATTLNVGKLFYRIVSVDHSAKKDLSDIVSVSLGRNSTGIIVYPNPAKGRLSFSSLEKVTSIQLYNSAGAIVRTFTVSNRGEQGYDISGLPNGLYIVRLRKEDGGTEHIRVSVAK